MAVITYPKVALLIKETSKHSSYIRQYYTDHIEQSCTVIGLPYPQNNKITVKAIKENIVYVLEKITDHKIKILLIADAAYFKFFTGITRIAPNQGYILPCTLIGYEHIKVVNSINYQTLFYDPTQEYKIKLGNSTINAFFSGTYAPPGSSTKIDSYYAFTEEELKCKLDAYLTHPVLACDLETYGLSLSEAHIATIGFSCSENQGFAAVINMDPNNVSEETQRKFTLIRDFFIAYTGMLIFHNASFDVKHLIYQCFMEHPLDRRNLVDGLDVLFRNTQDTQLMAYLAYNTTVRAALDLKSNVQEFVGNYAQKDISDITKIPIADLLSYQLTDCCATFYLYNKLHKILVKDNQLDVYNNLFRRAVKNTCHMELSGMPMHRKTILELHKMLAQISKDNLNILNNSKLVKKFNWERQVAAFTKKNSQLKKKYIPIEDFATTYNPSSSIQTQQLLFEFLKLDPIGNTASGASSVDMDTLKGLYAKLLREHDINDEDI